MEKLSCRMTQAMGRRWNVGKKVKCRTPSTGKDAEGGHMVQTDAEDQAFASYQAFASDQPDYEEAALYLAKSYGNLLKEKKYIEKVLSGEFTYTEDDALEELISTTASTESDTGIRVQTSNISNTTERIGMLLANGFVEKRNREILREVLDDSEGRRYLYWKLDVVETAKAERMDAFERGLFDRHYVRGWTYKMIREGFTKKKLYNRNISQACKHILGALGDEVEARSYIECEAELAECLLREAEYGQNGDG